MLKGTLDDFTLADIFRLLSLSKRTGQLDVERKAGSGRVFFRDGEVYYAESSLSREPLGQKLIRSGAITENVLRKALDQHAETGERVGDILVSSEAVNLEQIESAVRQQIEDSVFDLLRWELGQFEWQGDLEVDVEVPIGVSVENLIMEASRRLDELEVIQRKIPTMGAVLAMAPQPPEGALEINITPEEWRVLVLVDGIRTLSDIAAMCELDEFQAMRTMYGLVSAGLVDVADTGEEIDVEVAAGESVTSWEAEAAEAAEEPEEQPELEAVEEAFESQPELEAVEEAFEEPEEHPEPEAVEEAEAEPEWVAGESEVEPEEFPSEPEAEGMDAVAEEAPAFLADEHEAEGWEEEGAEEEEALAQAASEGQPPDEWFEEPEVPVESFDAPGPEDLVTDVPTIEELDEEALRAELEPEPMTEDEIPSEEIADAEAEPAGVGEEEETFLSDLMGEPAPPTEVPEADVSEGEEPATEAPEPPAPDASPTVDRAAVVRELAGLFSDDDSPRRGGPAHKASEGKDDDERKRVEDDDQVTKGLISRLIDGVKGL
ncbi:MAG: DUF4388 domain-containing protein [Actinomycetota bacterium]